MKKYAKLSIAALCLALCVVLPLAFHVIPEGGSLFSPMHIPVFICGLACGSVWGLACGILGPVLGSVITGMPNAAYLPPMLVELAAYGLITGAMMSFVRTGRLYGDLYISLITAMLIGRVLAGLARAFLFAKGAFTMGMWFTGYFVGGIPGIIAHLILVPLLCSALMRAGLIERRYT